MTETTDRSIHWWSTALGAVFALATGLGLLRLAAPIVVVCALIYLLAAVVARRDAAWAGFAASLPLVGIAAIPGGAWVSLAVLGVAAVVLVVIGAVRGTWRTAINRAQLVAAAGFTAIAAVAIVTSPLVGGILIAIGLAAHGVWDIVHHRRNLVVTRPYAEFCAVLDLVLAAIVVVRLVVG